MVSPPIDDMYPFLEREEYEQVKQRLEFLRGQITDLQEARQSLNKVIQAMEKNQKYFYIAKNLAASAALKGKLSWELNGESFEPLTADIAIKVPEGNETAIVDGNIIIFNQSKFEKLFQYDYKSQLISEQKAKEIEDAYSLSFPEGLTLNALLEEKKPLVKKLQNIEIGAMKQDQLLDYADEMQLELMKLRRLLGKKLFH